MIKSSSSYLLNVARKSRTNWLASLSQLTSESKLGINKMSQPIFNPNIGGLLSIEHQTFILTTTRLSSKLQLKQCWQCKGNLSNVNSQLILCPHCNAPQLIDDGLNFFQVFGLNVSYDVDVNQIKQKYLALQRTLHPDKFATRPKEEQEMSAYLSSLVNKAYRVIINPYERALYILNLNGVTIEEDETDFKMDPDFLKLMFTLNELIADADDKSLQEMKQDIESTINTLEEKISKEFKSNSLQDVKEALCKLKFYINVMDKITQKD